MANIEIHSDREQAGRHASATGCACGGHDESMPELDVQTIPHAVRHAAIFGALEGLGSGAGLILSATHDPVPLLQQLAQRAPDQFETEYLQQGPDRWRIRVQRRSDNL